MKQVLKKQVLALLLSCLLLFCCSPAVLAGEEENEEVFGAFSFQRIHDQTEIEIIAYNGLEETVSIPDTIHGLPVTSVREKTLDGKVEAGIISSDDLPITVIELGANISNFSTLSLENCKELTEIRLSSSNQSFTMRDGMLLNADGTRVVLYPAASEAFSITIPEGVTSIAPAAFAQARNLRFVHFPRSLITIESGNPVGAFENCTSLVSLRFPTALTTIGDYAFVGCTVLNEVFIYDFEEINIGTNAFFDCPSLLSVLLLENVKSIGAEAFGFLHGVLNPAESEKVPNFKIYGYNSGVAQRYATNNGFSFGAAQINFDFMEDVTLTGDVDTLPSLSGVFSTRITEGEDYDAIQKQLIGVGSYYVYSFETMPVFATELAHKVNYNIPAPASLSSGKVSALYFDGTGFSYAPAMSVQGSDWMGNEMTRILLDFEAVGTFVLIGGEHMPGNANGDGIVDVDDLSLMAKMLANWDVEYDYLSLDTNGDGTINVDDLTLFAKNLAGWDALLLPYAATLGA